MSTVPKSIGLYLAAIGAKGGAAKTAAKAAAAASNGKKGGRPPGVKDSKPRVRGSAKAKPPTR